MASTARLVQSFFNSLITSTYNVKLNCSSNFVKITLTSKAETINRII
jgi:hypothetical protein